MYQPSLHGPDSSRYRSQRYLSQDTIAAVATGLGGAVAIIRISGPLAFHALHRLAPEAEGAEERKMVRAALKHPESRALLDDALLVKFVAPLSFTGEDVVELHIHGGEFLASRMMETLASLGVRQALPGEFSFRAIRNGKTSLSQAQAVSDLIAASNEGAIQLALEKMSGAQNELIRGISREMRDLCVLGEVGIDFSDQDVEEVSLPALKRRASAALSQLEELRASYDRGSRIQQGVRVAFTGLPNAGKSSFFNALLGEDRSIVSEIAGTTRDVVRERITLQGRASSVTLRLEDTAGLRSSSDFVEKKGIERTYAAARNADLVIFLVDPETAPPDVETQWKELSAAISGISSRTVGVFTKIDVRSEELVRSRLQDYASFGIQRWVCASSLTSQGLSEAIATIVELSERWVHRASGEVLLTRLDHLQAVNAAIDHLSRAQGTPEIDLFAADVRQSLHALGPLIGDTLPDDILGKIFSDFCIGK